MSVWSTTGTGSSTFSFLGNNSTTTTSTGTYSGSSSTNYIIYTPATGNAVYAPSVPFSQVPQAPQIDPRILNKYLNASDLLEEFIKDLGPLGVRQSDVLGIPIEMFINWLILRSAEEEDKEEGELKEIPFLRSELVKHRPDRCRSCGRFISKIRRESNIHFCSTEHFDKFNKDMLLLESI